MFTQTSPARRPVMRIVRSVGMDSPAACAFWMSSPQPDDDELVVLAEVLGGDEIGAVGLGVVAEAVPELLGVHAGEAEHERGRLHAAVLVALLARHAGAEGHVAVAGAIDDDLGQDALPGPLCFR